MENKTAFTIGLIGGIVAAVGVFLAWVTASAGGFSVSVSGWDLLRASASDVPYVAVVLVGGILALVGGACMLAKAKAIGYLLPIGGILALVGGIWGFAKVNEAIGAVGGIAGVSVSVGYGVYIGIVGGILAIVGSFGLKGEEPKRERPPERAAVRPLPAGRTIFCPSCRTKLPASAKFCDRCGKKVKR